jgi:hypothetical protein
MRLEAAEQAVTDALADVRRLASSADAWTPAGAARLAEATTWLMAAASRRHALLGLAEDL